VFVFYSLYCTTLIQKNYNYRLAQRLNWFEATRTPVNPCPLNVSVVPVEGIYQNVPEFRTQTRDGRKKDGNCLPVTKKGDKHPNIINGYVAWETVQLADLAQTKKLFPEYQSIHSRENASNFFGAGKQPNRSSNAD